MRFGTAARRIARRIERFINPPKHPSRTIPTVQQLLSGPFLTPSRPLPYEKATPLERLYLMFYYFVLGDHNTLQSLVIQFFHHSDWAVMDIPDPKDPDPIRYAILSALPFWLCEVFNRRIELCLHRDAPSVIDVHTECELRARLKVFESVPNWTKHVPKLGTKTTIPNMDGEPPREQFLCERLMSLGIVAEKFNLHFV